MTEEQLKNFSEPPQLKPYVDSYQNRPVLCIPTGNRKFPYFTFGIAKARAILNNLEAIKAFVEATANYKTGVQNVEASE